MVALACVQIPIIKLHLVQNLATRLASPYGTSIIVKDVRGALPFHLAIKSIKISNASGDLAHLSDLKIDLAATMLLRGKIQIKRITLDRLDWLGVDKSAQQTPQTNNIPAVLLAALPRVLDQTILKCIQINIVKTPTASLSFHFQKDGIESCVEIKTIANNAVPTTYPVEGIFRLAPKGLGATATLHLTDLGGLLSGHPLTATGDIHIADLNTLLPVGSFSIVENNTKTVLQASTAGNDTRIQIDHPNSSFTCDLNLKQLLEQHTTPIKNVVLSTNKNKIQGTGNLTFDADHFTINYDGSHSGGAKLKGEATWMIQTHLFNINGVGSWQKTPIQFDCHISDIGTNSRLRTVTAIIDSHTIALDSADGLLLDSNGGSFTLNIDNHIFSGTTSFDQTGCITHIKPTWKWVKDSVIAIHTNDDGARIEGALDIDYNTLTNGIIHGTGHASIQLNHMLDGSFSCALSNGVAGGTALGHTTAKIQFNKGDGELSVTSGNKEILHHPYGMGKGQLSLSKQTLHMEALQLSHNQQVIALKAPLLIDFNAQKIPDFIVSVGQKGIIKGDERKQEITIENIPLLAARMFNASWDMGGLLNGHIELTSLFNHYKGHIVLSQLAPYLSSPLRNDDLSKNFSWTIQFERQEKQILINTHTQRNQTHIFTAKGAVSLDKTILLQNTIDINIDGELDVSLISSLLNTPDRLGGLLNVTLAVKGTLADVNLSGQIDVRNGLYDSADNGTYISNIAGTLKAAGKKLIIEHLAGNDARDQGKTKKETHIGTLDFTGFFEFIGLALPHSALNLKLNDLIVVHRDDMTMRATGDIKIQGPGLQSKITGAVTLTPSLVMLEEFTNDDDLYIDIEGLTTHKKAKKSSDLQLFPIELELHIDKNFYIRDLDIGLISQWTGTVMVKGDLSDPYLEGTLTATQGKFSFFGKPLKISEAKIWYDSIDKNKPNVWLVGTRNVDDVTVQLHVSGRVPSIKHAFVSDPALPEDEVLARLLFGKELSKISAGQSVQLASVGASLNAKMGPNFLDNLRSAFGFDTFELKEDDIKANSSELGQTSSQSLRVGKEFENIRISIDQSIGSIGSKATVSTGLGKNVYLDLEAGEKNAGSGAGLSWVYRY